MNLSFGNLVSLHTQFQLLPPLTHIAAVLNSKICQSLSKNINKTESKREIDLIQENEEIYPQSFSCAVKSVKEVFSDNKIRKLIANQLLTNSIDRHLFENKSIKILLLECLSKKRKPLPWVVSHKSHWSFDDNKYCRNEHLNYRLLCKPLYSTLNNYHSKRTFKTKSQYTGIGSVSRNGKTSTPIGEVKLGSIFNLRKDKTVNSPENEKIIKGLINDENLSNGEKQKIKIAFAEGYLAAEPRLKISSKLRFFNIFRDLMGIVLIVAILFSFMGGSFRRVLIGGSNEVHPEEIDVTFEDVKGVDEAKQELQEIVEFLKNPEKFSVLGGKLPKGVLLVGPPGTGKTLLARAVAGEAGVPFFHAAGPEFDEILVGQGARRVRDLFSTAKLKAPCVVFIDEIDSVGAKRSNSVLHPYANQTINQLLTEMDGFRQNEGVIVLGATNRRDDLDRALLRPGRFDVEVQVPVPDLRGRKDILELYLGKVKYNEDVDMEVLARGTTGFTGADLENMVNQAALRAAIEGSESVTMKYLESSRDKVLMGPERKNKIPDEEANMITAYHEGGHALVSYYTRDSTPLHKVTIVPRGPSLGHTAYIPDKERFHVTKSEMLARMDSLMGGRAAEELIFGLDKITTGASSDLKEATALATHMVKEWGMSEKVGMRTFDDSQNSLVVVNDLSATTSENIDSEIKKILQDSYERAKSILKAHHREHRLIAEALLKYETLDAEEFKAILTK